MLDVIRKKVFLSGPMSSIHNNNAAAFADAHATLKQMGAGRVYDPALKWLSGPHEKLPHEHYMRRTISELVRCDSTGEPLYDYIVMLPGWEDSLGARTERLVAEACGIEVLLMEDENDEPFR